MTDKVHKLIPLKAGTKIVDNGEAIRIDITLPLDRDDYAFLKEMYDMKVDVSGNIVDGEGMVLWTFSNAIRSISSNRPELDEKQMDERALEDKSND